MFLNVNIQQTIYFKIKSSRGEICVENFILPANGASLGSYLVKNGLFCINLYGSICFKVSDMYTLVDS